jgi:uncharacterized protein YbbK (DUF523 family)
MIECMVSACLAGCNCKYNGRNNQDEEIVRMVKEGKALPLCPEQLGGLPSPRVPSEISGGEGKDVLDGKAVVENAEGKDVTDSFLKGAREVARLCRVYGITQAILREGSPSCGVTRITTGLSQVNPFPARV